MMNRAALVSLSSRTHQGRDSPSMLQRLRRAFSPRVLERRPVSNTVPAPSSGSRPGEFERVFRYFDEDGDGRISPAELRSCMRTLGEELSAEDVESVVGSTDSDGDGLLGLDDFVRLVEAEGEEEKVRDLREAFRAYATEGRGCITPKSLRSALGRLGEPKSIRDCKAMIRRFDLNGDGVISFEEFRTMML